MKIEPIKHISRQRSLVVAGITAGEQYWQPRVLLAKGNDPLSHFSTFDFIADLVQTVEEKNRVALGKRSTQHRCIDAADLQMMVGLIDHEVDEAALAHLPTATDVVAEWEEER